MTSTSPPLEAQRFGRSQTPESPRPVHLPEPKNIPVLLNQMDPVFNDTATYNIPSNQTFSPYSDSNRAFPESLEEHDAVQDFLRSAEAESARSEGAPGYPVTEDKFDPAMNDTASAPPYANNVPAGLSFPQSSEQAYDPYKAFNSQHPTSTNQISTSTGGPSFETSDLKTHQNTGNNGLNTNAESQAHNDDVTASSIAQTGTGVDYQSLLDTITKSASTAPGAETITVPTTASSNVVQSSHSLPPIPGLPPKPPPQENQPEFSNYQTQEDALPYLSFPNAAILSVEQSQSQNKLNPNAAHESTLMHQPETGFAMSATFPSSIIGQPDKQVYPAPIDTSSIQNSHAPGLLTPQGERPWTPKTQALYDQFLEDERRYVTEGIWDKFPVGSRLFVGNLPSEKVTKRDLFHTFHKHGRLAQISIKQAYGFIQYLEAASCQEALSVEQGVEIRGRKVHLEISKPQKNTRKEGGNKSSARRRSRSPDRGAVRTINDRRGSRPAFSDFRDEPGRRRDDYRLGRSPSPRGYRSRDDYRPSVQSPRGYLPQDGRPRSPAYAGFPQSPSGYDEDAALPLPRRDPRGVPDVQILILDPAVAHSFINWVEQGFHAKSLRASTIWLSPRLPLQAVIKRQIIEGVQAIVKLSQANQHNSKIPLQVFDRSAGVSNVNFNEYIDLDVPVAADIVIHARQKERASIHQPPTPTYPSGPPYNAQNPYAPPQIAQQAPQHYVQHVHPSFQPSRAPQPQQYPYPAQQQQFSPTNQTPTTPSANAPNLQQLLANLRQPQDSQTSPQNPIPMQNGRPTDLGGLLSNIAARQQNQAQQYNQSAQVSQVSPQGYGGTAGLQGYGGGSQQNVQSIMDQLARFKR